jgi:nucleoside-diphosphate-sugar epimerase
LQEKYAEDKGVPFISVRAPIFIDQDPSMDMAVKKIPKGVYPSFFEVNARCAWVHTDQVCQALVDAALTLPDDALGKRIPITAQPPASNNDVAACLSEILGRSIVAKPLVPPFVLTVASWFSAQMYDIRAMVNWINTGAYNVSDEDLALQKQYFGEPLSLKESFSFYLKENNLLP